ncbi:MAG: hypothetical protein N4A33_04360 [Bacteriovoracaceae bacterium]|jgi:hypothetical protein|nr:hypothetical protein [Bacteriovoracaceae bacterium]
MKSNYLENMIALMSEESQKSSEIEIENIKKQMNKLDASWRRKYFLENYMLPFIFLVFFASIYLSFEGVLFIVNLIPFLTALGFAIVVMYQNYRLNQLDLSLDLTQYGKRQYSIYKNQIVGFKWFRWIVYPVVIASILFELAYYIYTKQFLAQFIVILIKVAILGGVYWYEKDSIEKLWTKIKNL